MEAEDTVMSWERVRILMADNDKHNRGGESRVEEYCKAQAEISFKAGMEEGRNYETHQIVYKRGKKDGKKAGIREVVEWIERNSESDDNNPQEFSVFPEKDWQAKLKEWGIENE